MGGGGPKSRVPAGGAREPRVPTLRGPAGMLSSRVFTMARRGAWPPHPFAIPGKIQDESMGEMALCPVTVGRESETRRLTEALRAAREGDCRVLVVTGDAGLGKTRLATDLRR